jgi:hypothetical protein
MTEAEKREKRGFVQSAGAARRIVPRRPTERPWLAEGISKDPLGSVNGSPKSEFGKQRSSPRSPKWRSRITTWLEHFALCIRRFVVVERRTATLLGKRGRRPIGSGSTLSPSIKAILSLIQALLPAMTAVIGAVWIAFTYLDQQKEIQRQQSNQATKDSTTRLIKARKPFTDKQLALFETPQIVGSSCRRRMSKATIGRDSFEDLSSCIG